MEKKHAKDESKLQAKFFKRRQEELAAVDQEMKGKYQEAMNELKERLKKTSSKAEKAGNGDDVSTFVCFLAKLEVNITRMQFLVIRLYSREIQLSCKYIYLH